MSQALWRLPGEVSVGVSLSIVFETIFLIGIAYIVHGKDPHFIVIVLFR